MPGLVRYPDLRHRAENHVLQGLDTRTLTRGSKEMKKGQIHVQESQNQVGKCSL